MDYREFSDLLFEKYIKIGEIMTRHIIFKEENILKYLKMNGFLNDDEQEYRNLIKANDTYYILKACWYGKILSSKLTSEEKRVIINKINNL